MVTYIPYRHLSARRLGSDSEPAKRVWFLSFTGRTPVAKTLILEER